MRLLVRIACIFTLLEFPLRADVTYEEDYGISAGLHDFGASNALTLATQPTEFDLPEYVPMPFDSNRTQPFKVYIQGNKLARIGALGSQIYDLDAGTVILIDNAKRQFSVKTFAEMQRRIDHSTPHPKDTQVSIEETGGRMKTPEGEAAEFRVFTYSGTRNGSGAICHAIYWIVPHLASAEAASFRDRCLSRYKNTPAVCSLSQSMGFGELASSGEAIPGYVIAKVAEARVRIQSSSSVRPPMLDASKQDSPLPQAQPGESDPEQLHLTADPLRRADSRIGNFIDGPVDPKVFTVPDGYRKKK